MKTKEISVEVKKSRNFQTYTAGEVLYIEETMDLYEIETMRIAAFGRCRASVMAQIKLDGI